jgi:hypothetical protein
MKTGTCLCTITDEERKEEDLLQGQNVEEQALAMLEEGFTLLRRALASRGSIITDERACLEVVLAQLQGPRSGGSHGGANASTNATAARNESPGVAAPVASLRRTEGRGDDEVCAEEEESEHSNNGGESLSLFPY